MQLGLLTVPFHLKPLKEVLPYLSSLGITALEIGTGGYPGAAHIDPDLLLENEKERTKLLKLLSKYKMTISALSCHGNSVSPDKELATKSDSELKKTIRLASLLGVKTVITFSGCPGGSPEDKMPNWVTCPWPDEYLKVLDYQWNEVLIPYWKELNAFAASYNVRIAFEMHPGFCVYNPETMLKLRNACGENLGANVDPSHLIWQGIDVPLAIKQLKGAVFHFHAKDTKIDAHNVLVNGVLDTKHYGDEINRSWIFRSCGFGMTREKWCEIISALKLIGYDGAVSIEHEDSVMSTTEGLEKAVSFLKDIIIYEPKPNSMWWA